LNKVQMEHDKNVIINDNDGAVGDNEAIMGA
jgi:hypothetical protein